MDGQILEPMRGSLWRKKKPGDSSFVPLVRGRGIIKGVKPYELLPVVASLSVRSQWDARYQEGHALVRYSRKSYKFYSIQKGVFLVWPRDFVGVRDVAYSEDGTIEIVQTSVPNDEKTPDVDGKVRGTLTAAGWILRPLGDDTDVTYLVKGDPNGSIPQVLVDRGITETPLCIVKIAEFIHSVGLVCYIPQNSISSVVRMETYDHDSKTFTVALIGAAGDVFDIAVDTKTMYKNGYMAVLNDAVTGVTLSGDGSAKLHVEIGEEADGAKFSITIMKT